MTDGQFRKKTITYKNSPEEVAASIEPVLHQWEDLKSRAMVYEIENIELINSTVSISQPMRGHQSGPVRHVDFENFYYGMRSLHTERWVIGDVVRRNFIYAKDRLIFTDFEPFLVFSNNGNRLYKTTAPYHHQLDRKHRDISPRSDLLGFFTFYLAEMLGFKSSMQCFENYKTFLTEITTDAEIDLWNEMNMFVSQEMAK